MQSDVDETSRNPPASYRIAATARWTFSEPKNDSNVLPVVVSNTTQHLAELYRARGKPDEAAKHRAML